MLQFKVVVGTVSEGIIAHLFRPLPFFGGADDVILEVCISSPM